ncbi:MAG: hypothetical protein J6O73_18590 [Lachnospiraceae bacterium]|nr:hypothetical protein [Lachnospiraceae bacterium]MBO6208914.1 hypothetical protein [Lachnospiraceae bacterium]
MVLDDLVIISHGNYYAVILNENNMEHLTVSPDGRVKSDDSSLIISELPQKTADRIVLCVCNTGLLDAINIYYDKEITVDKTFRVTGNVAQMFLETQNVKYVDAYDGSVSFNIWTGADKLSNEQESFPKYLAELEPYREFTPTRNGDSPIGKMTYYKGETDNHVHYYLVTEDYQDGKKVRIRTYHYINLNTYQDDNTIIMTD